MRWTWVALLALLLPDGPLAARGSSVVDEILEILRQRHIITEQRYRELRERLEAERREAVRRLRQEVLAEMRREQRVEVGYRRGFYLRTTDGRFALRIGGRLNLDGRFFDRGHPEVNEFLLRRARMGLRGTLHRAFGFKVEADFAGGGASLKDGYLEARPWPALRLRAGQFKVPFSLEAVSSTLWMDFIERSMAASSLAPARDWGLVALGQLGQRVRYGIGLFNGARANRGDLDDDKDVAARVVVRPLPGLWLGGSLTYGHQRWSLPGDRDHLWTKGRFKTYGGTTFLKLADGVGQSGTRLRWGTELAWSPGPCWLQGEWMRMELRGMVDPAGRQHDLSVRGGYLNLGWFLTGERRSVSGWRLARVVPQRPFAPREGGWGALELAFRYDYLRFDEGFFAYGLADPTRYTDRVSAYTLGVNWFLNEAALLRLNWSHLDFDDYVSGAGDDQEDLLSLRFQLVW